MTIDVSKTLTELEHDDWGDDPKITGLISRCYPARKIPLKDMSIEHLRLLIGQNISAEILVPLVLDILHEEPLAMGDFYPGDLLVSVLRLPTSFWDQYPEMKQRLETRILAGLDESDLDRMVMGTISQYRNGTLSERPIYARHAEQKSSSTKKGKQKR